MTRKDYELIASALKQLKQEQREAGAFAHNPDLSEVASVIALYLADENPRFDRAKFLQASGVC